VERSPAPAQFDGQVQLANNRKRELAKRLNRARGEDEYTVRNVYICLDPNSRSVKGIGYLVEHDELPDQARLRWQNSFSPKSYHSAIISSRANHRDVTAYDVAIGSGRACSDKHFYRYLCALADWRILEASPTDIDGQSVMTWPIFITRFSGQLACTREEWQDLILANKHYYNTGELPIYLPLVGQCLGKYLVCESVGGSYGG
jgi:hypothetical protein